jgi:hypothetical protein
MRHLRPIAAVLAALGLVLAGGATAAAKGGNAIATLDEPLPPSPPAGSTITVAWSLALPQDDGTTQPFWAENVFIRFTPPSGKPIEAAGYQDRQGHFVAKVKVPKAGLGTMAIGIRGEMCPDGGTCAPSTEFFRISETTAFDVAAAAALARRVPANGQRPEAAVPPPAPVVPATAPDPAAAPHAATPPVPAQPAAPSVDGAWLAMLAIIGLALAGVAIAARGRGRTTAA